MFNYAKNFMSINGKIMAKVDEFNVLVREYATESVAHSAEKKELEGKLDKAITDGNKDEAKTLKGKLDSINDKWTARTKAVNLKLYGGKDEDKKVEGICSFVTDDLYKSYVEYVTSGTVGTYKKNLKKFVLTLINEDSVKDNAFNHFYEDIVTTMSSVRLNSNKNLAEGCAYITTINKRTFKKMFLGAIADTVAKNRTLKVTKKAENK